MSRKDSRGRARPYITGELPGSMPVEDRIRYDVFMKALAQLCNEHRVVIDADHGSDGYEYNGVGVHIINPAEYQNVMPSTVLTS